MDELFHIQSNLGTFFVLVMIILPPLLLLGLIFILFGAGILREKKREIFTLRLWLIIALASIIISSSLLLSFGKDGYCGEGIKQECGRWI